ncbi:MAG: helix-turn-helix transcriptional regulator [Candidatus Melainabacteria bacterium]|nr:helix-turn-helix transcriptional regulator [Candidatus Melainabacteria bacterium]
MGRDADKKLWLIAFGATISERRNYVAMTQQQLADHSGVHRTYISDIERGSRNVTVTTVNRIAAALETTAARIFFQTDKKHLELKSLTEAEAT